MGVAVDVVVVVVVVVLWTILTLWVLLPCSLLSQMLQETLERSREEAKVKLPASATIPIFDTFCPILVNNIPFQSTHQSTHHWTTLELTHSTLAPTRYPQVQEEERLARVQEEIRVRKAMEDSLMRRQQEQEQQQLQQKIEQEKLRQQVTRPPPLLLLTTTMTAAT